MHARTAEWVEKVEGDYRVSLLAAGANNPSEPDAVCFHAQQCIEKYAKAFLTEHDSEFSRTHSMEYLHERCATIEPDFKKYGEDFGALDEYSVEIRYPGDKASEEDAREAVVVLTRLRAFIRQKLGLDQPTSPEGT